MEGGKIKKKKTIGEVIFIVSLLIFPLIQLAIWYFYLNFESVLQAFKTVHTDLSYEWVGFLNFKSVWSDFTEKGSLLYVGFWNNWKMYIVSWILSTPTSFLFAYIIFKKYPMSGAYRLLVMVPSILSSILTGLIFRKFMFNLPKLGMGGELPDFLGEEKYRFWTVVIYSVVNGFSTSSVIYPNVMNDIDAEILESAQLEGVSALEEFWYIIFPYCIPTFTTFTIGNIPGLFGAGPLFSFWGYNAPSDVYTVGYHIFKQTMNGGAAWYGYTSALNMMIMVITIPMTFGAKTLLEKVDPLND